MGCDNCADLGHTDDAGKVTCPECKGTGNVTAQADADRELGRMIRAIYERRTVLSISKGTLDSAFLMLDGMLQARTDTLDEAVKKAWEVME